MDHLNCALPNHLKSDLRKMLTPVGDFIASCESVNEQRYALVATIEILVETVNEVNAMADAYIASRI